MNNFRKLVRVAAQYGAIAPVLLLLLTTRGTLAIDGRAPEQIIEETSAEVMRVLNEEQERLKADPALVNDFIGKTIIPIVDLESMGKLILGRYWKQASEEQRSSFVSEFKDMLVRIYAKSLVDHAHARVRVLPDRGKQESKFRTVQTELDIGSGRAPLQVAYVFRNNKQNEWKVFDLSVDGLSLVKNFRTSFNQEIKETSLNALIERLINTNRAGVVDEIRAE